MTAKSIIFRAIFCNYNLANMYSSQEGLVFSHLQIKPIYAKIMRELLHKVRAQHAIYFGGRDFGRYNPPPLPIVLYIFDRKWLYCIYVHNIVIVICILNYSLFHYSLPFSSVFLNMKTAGNWNGLYSVCISFFFLFTNHNKSSYT